MEANLTDCSVIQACLSRSSDKCGELDLKAMEYEAKTLSDRLDAIADARGQYVVEPKGGAH